MRKNAHRRVALLDATLTVIAEGGVDAVRARRVAEVAGVPLGSITYWFDDRDALIREAFDHFLALDTAFLDGLLAAHPPTTPAALVDLLVAMVAAEFDDPGRVMTEYELILAAGRDPGLAVAFDTWERTLLDGVEGVLAALGARHPEDDARTLVEAVRGFEVLALTRPPPDLDAFRRRLTRLVEALTHPSHDGATR